MGGKLDSLSYFCFFISAACLVVFIYLNPFLFDLANKNQLINIPIIIVFLAVVIYSAYVSVRVNINLRRWRLQNVNTEMNKVLLLANISGVRFEPSFCTDEKKREDFIFTCAEHLDWRVRILNYISNAVMMTGILGTFIGLIRSVDMLPPLLMVSLVNDVSSGVGEVLLVCLSDAFSSAVTGIIASLCISFLGIINERLNSEFIEWVMV